MTFAKSSLSVYQLLETRAKKNPQDIAIVASGKSSLTYSGLFDAVIDVVN